MGNEASRFKKGNPGGPGRPKELLGSDTVKALLGRLWHCTRDEIESIAKDPNAKMGEIMVASIMARAVRDGDASRLAFLLDRAIGRPKTEEDAPPKITALSEDDRDLLTKAVKSVGAA